MLELPPSLAVERNGRLVLVTSCICLNAFLLTGGWSDRLVALCNGGPWEHYFPEQDL